MTSESHVRGGEVGGATSTADRDDIMKTLLSHEKSSVAVATASAAAAAASVASTQSSSSDSDIDEMELTANNYSGTTHTAVAGVVRC